jgi:hypothetical protein
VNVAAGGAAAAGAAAAIAAIKASGVLVRVDPAEFLKILGRAPDSLVVSATGGFFSKNYRYLMSYRGLAFYTQADNPLQLPAAAEVVAAKSIWTP